MNYGYARVSSVGQKISGNSLEDQVSQLKAAGCREEIIFKEQFTRIGNYPDASAVYINNV